MEKTKLSSKGQVIIPKAIRAAQRWEIGQELVVVNVGDGVLLKPKTPFEGTTLQQVAGCLPKKGKAKTLAEMNEAINKSIRKEWRGSR